MRTLERCYSKMYNISRDIKEGNSDISSDEMRRGLVSVFSLCRKYNSDMVSHCQQDNFKESVFYKANKLYCPSQCPSFQCKYLCHAAKKKSYWTIFVEKISLGIAYLGTIDTNSTKTLEEFTYSSLFDKENPTITKRCYEEKDEVNNTTLLPLLSLTSFSDLQEHLSLQY